jgi:hypothetical protein
LFSFFVFPVYCLMNRNLSWYLCSWIVSLIAAFFLIFPICFLLCSLMFSLLPNSDPDVVDLSAHIVHYQQVSLRIRSYCKRLW